MQLWLSLPPRLRTRRSSVRRPCGEAWLSAVSVIRSCAPLSPAACHSTMHTPNIASAAFLTSTGVSARAGASATRLDTHTAQRATSTRRVWQNAASTSVSWACRSRGLRDSARTPHRRALARRPVPRGTLIANNPGCTAADVCRYEWSGRGHSASYERVRRLARRGFITRTQVGARIELRVTDKGMYVGEREHNAR